MRSSFPLALAALTLAAGVAAGQNRTVEPPVTAAYAVYQQSCATCHGDRGDGRGSFSDFLLPRPRDFSRGVYKLRSTPAGTLPLDADLARTISYGVPGTAMRGWGATLGPQLVSELVQLVKGFSPRFRREAPGAPVPIPPAPAAATAARGAEVYERLACGRCHGATGRGDGAEAGGLKHLDGSALALPDFSRRGAFKAGETDEDAYRSLATGLDGTPMHAVPLSDEERWSLVRYLTALAQ